MAANYTAGCNLANTSSDDSVTVDPQRGSTASSASESTKSDEAADVAGKRPAGPPPPSTARDRLRECIDRRLVLGFTPVYFVSIMGTGISANIMYNFPYPARWLRDCLYIMFGFAVFFWSVTSALYVALVTRSRRNLIKFNCDPTVAPFMGAYAMGYNTLVNYIYLLTGKSWVIGSWTLWWIAVALSLYTALVVFYLSLIAKNRQTHHLRIRAHEINATLLLPVVTLTVAALLGGMMTPDLPTSTLKLITMLVCYVMWLVAIALAFVIITVYFWKLFVHKIPCTATVFTSFLPVGVMGQGAYGVAVFGVNFHNFVADNSAYLGPQNLSYLAAFDDAQRQTLALVIGHVVLFLCTLILLFLTSFGYFCTVIAVFSCLSKISPFTANPNPQYTARSFRVIKFLRAFWAMTFPLGTMALSNTQLHTMFNNLKAFRVVGAMYATLLLVITVGCLVGCVYTVGVEARYILRGSGEQEPLDLA